MSNYYITLVIMSLHKHYIPFEIFRSLDLFQLTQTI